MPKYTKKDIDTTYRFYDEIKRDIFRARENDYAKIKNYFNEAMESYLESKDYELEVDPNRNRVVAAYLFLRNIGELEFFRDARRKARNDSYKEGETVESHAKLHFEKMKKTKEYQAYNELLLDFKAKVMQTTKLTNEQLEVLVIDSEAIHSGYENICEIAENGDKTYEKVEFKEETGLTGFVKRMVGKETEKTEKTFYNKTFNEKQAEQEMGIPIQVESKDLTDDEIKNVDVKKKYKEIDEFGEEIKQRDYTNKVNIEVDLETKVEEKKKPLVFKKTGRGFVISDSLEVDLNNIQKNIEAYYKDAKTKTSQELLNDFNNNFGLSSDVTEEEINANKFFQGKEEIQNNSTNEKLVKLNNDFLRKTKGSIFTPTILSKGLSILKAQKEKYESKNFFVRLFTYFSKENKELRNNIAKMESIFINSGITKKELNKVVKDAQSMEGYINDLSSKKQVYSDKYLKSIYTKDDAIMNDKNTKKIDAKEVQETIDKVVDIDKVVSETSKELVQEKSK